MLLTSLVIFYWEKGGMWVIYDIKSSRALGAESFYDIVDGENCQGLNQLPCTKLN